MKRYERPTLTKLTPEEARLKLLRHASAGDQAAIDFLNKMFPDDAKKPAASSEGHMGKTIRKGHS